MLQLRRCLKQLVQLYASDSSHKEAFTVELVLQLWSQVRLWTPEHAGCHKQLSRGPQPSLCSFCMHSSTHWCVLRCRIGVSRTTTPVCSWTRGSWWRWDPAFTHPMTTMTSTAPGTRDRW